MGEVIGFEKPYGQYSFLCPSSDHSIALDGKIWPTAEHYILAQKFKGRPTAERIRKMRNISDARKVYYNKRLTGVEDWDKTMNGAVMLAMLTKFSQHFSLKEQLLATGTASLVYQYRDPILGAGSDNSGKNLVGGVIEDVREKLRLLGKTLDERMKVMESQLSKAALSGDPNIKVETGNPFALTSDKVPKPFVEIEGKKIELEAPEGVENPIDRWNRIQDD